MWAHPALRSRRRREKTCSRCSWLRRHCLRCLRSLRSRRRPRQCRRCRLRLRPPCYPRLRHDLPSSFRRFRWTRRCPRSLRSRAAPRKPSRHCWLRRKPLLRWLGRRSSSPRYSVRPKHFRPSSHHLTPVRHPCQPRPRHLRLQKQKAGQHSESKRRPRHNTRWNRAPSAPNIEPTSMKGVARRRGSGTGSGSLSSRCLAGYGRNTSVGFRSVYSASALLERERHPHASPNVPRHPAALHNADKASSWRGARSPTPMGHPAGALPCPRRSTRTGVPDPRQAAPRLARRLGVWSFHWTTLASASRLRPAPT
jgi:hypothetical protein